MLVAVVVDVLVVDVLVAEVEVLVGPVLVAPPPDAADCPVLPPPSPAPPVPLTPPLAPDPAPPSPTPLVPVGTNGRNTTAREVGDVCATAGSRYGRSTGTAGIGVNDFTVTPGGGVLRVVVVAVEPGASIDGVGEVRVTVVVVCEGTRLPSA